MRTALVTGSNRGLGHATATRLAENGHHVIIAARDGLAARATAEDLVRKGLSASAAELDVTDPESVSSAASRIAQEHGALDVLVNNAGILPEATMGLSEAVSGETFRITLETNVIGAARVTEAFLPLLRKSDGARIVNVSSRMGSLVDQTDPESPYYATVVPAYQSSKAALNSMTIGLAKALADTSIVVTSVCPGFVRTELTPANADQALLSAEEAAETVARAAMLPAGAASGTFVDANGTVPW